MGTIFLKLDHQANNVCLSSHQQRFSEWKKLLRETRVGEVLTRWCIFNSLIRLSTLVQFF